MIEEISVGYWIFTTLCKIGREYIKLLNNQENYRVS